MKRRVRRPVGVATIALLMAIKGLSSLAMAVDLGALHLVQASRVGEVAAGVALVTGLLFLFKAYGLWGLHRSAWMLTLLLLAVDGAASATELLIGTRHVTAWISLALTVVIGSYLLQSGIRSLFMARREG
jgi:hypothetical protein